MYKIITAEDHELLGRIIPKVDYTAALSPFEGAQTVIKACQTVKEYGFATVDVYPTWVALAKQHMEGSDKGILVTVGFPHGSTTTQAKVAETKQCCIDGATEIDMVINIARMLDKDYTFVKNDVAEVVKCAGSYGAGVKLIIETGYLNDEQKCAAAELAVEAGAEYVKTCTGFGPGKASLHDIILLKGVVGERARVKASGGVASLEDQLLFIDHGADRVAGRGNIVEQLVEIGYKP